NFFDLAEALSNNECFLFAGVAEVQTLGAARQKFACARRLAVAHHDDQR
ncbi:MAG: hypothetical protein RJA50_1077, partial [Actinomycetota bacterium]